MLNILLYNTPIQLKLSINIILRSQIAKTHFNHSTDVLFDCVAVQLTSEFRKLSKNHIVHFRRRRCLKVG